MPVELTIEISDVRLGVIEASGAHVTPASAELVKEIQVTCDHLRGELTVEQVAELAAVRAVRAMFRAWGVDPSRYRPSSEALLRRVVQGKGLYFISNVVDVCNLCSIESGLPFGLYDCAALKPPIVFRLGATSETYVGIGKQTWHLAGRPVLVDQEGPFGSPISDSVRTMITESACEILAVIYCPEASELAALERAIEQFSRRLERFTGARVARTAMLS